MTERDPPKRRPFQKTVNLMDVLANLGHTPESFARVIGRNASGLRRIIKGGTSVTPSTARDIVEGLYAEGWKGDPERIVQLRNSTSRVTMDPARERTGRKPLELSSRMRVRLALAELMRALDREEVDRVYERVFGAKPGEKE